MTIKLSTYITNDAWVVSGGSADGGIKELEFSSEDMKMDETDSGVAAGTIFGVLDTLTFNPDTKGSVWFTFNVPSGFDLATDIKVDINFVLDTTDNGKTVYLGFKSWVIDSGDTPSEGSPDISQNESITSGSENTNVAAKLNLANCTISNTLLSENTLRISCKLTRESEDVIDTYTGSLHIVSARIYQE